MLGQPLDPWQRWLAIHLGELLVDGRLRFRTVLVLVARQNGKTFLAKALILYWLYVEAIPLILGTSTDRGYAKKLWERIHEEAAENEFLSAEGVKVRKQLGEESLKAFGGRAEYVIAANNGKAGRSLTVHRWLCDELREHKNGDAWAAASNAMNAVIDAQTVAITNQGGTEAVKLHELHDTALAAIEDGDDESDIGLFEWSSPDGMDPEDPEALAFANPNLGYRVPAKPLVGAARVAKATGGEELTKFITEVMCRYVPLLAPAIEPEAWRTCGAAERGKRQIDLSQHRDKVGCCVDVSLNGQHATLVAAAEIDDVLHLDVVHAWDGPTAVDDMVRELPRVISRVHPRSFGWFRNGPAAAAAARIAVAKGARRTWAPRGTEIREMDAHQAAACMGMAKLVQAGRVHHGDDELLDQHIEGTTPSWRGDAWVFQRRGRSSIDAAYAAAGAIQLAQTLPPPLPPLAAV